MHPIGSGYEDPVIRKGEPIIIHDYPEAYRKTVSKYSLRIGGATNEMIGRLYGSALIVPMKLEGKVIGCIQILSYKLNDYTHDNLEFSPGFQRSFQLLHS